MQGLGGVGIRQQTLSIKNLGLRLDGPSTDVLPLPSPSKLKLHKYENY
jgi:hypothetical protein